MKKFNVKIWKIRAKNNWHIIALAIIIIYFIFKGSYFAYKIKFALPPDEIYHVNVIEEYSETLLIPNNSAETYQYGPITDKPYLYHYTMGKLVVLNVFPMEDFVFLRLINVMLGVFTLITTYKIAEIFTKRKISKLLAVLLISNTLMFTFLSGSVNYDNLVNLISALSILFALKFIQKKKLTYLLILMILMAMGLLTKISFIPLALILTIVVFFDFFVLHFKKARKEFMELLKSFHIKEYVLLVIAVIFVGLSIELYLGNFLNYHKLDPKCTQVLTHEQCLNDPIYVRGLENQGKGKPDNVMNPIKYFAKWTIYMEERSLGVLAHQSIVKPTKELIPYNLAIIASFILYIRFLRPQDKHFKLLIYTGVIIGFYLFVLAFYQNYKTYANTGQLGLALQGRYTFPVLAPIFALFIYPFDRFVKKYWMLLLAYGIIALIFIWGEFFFFLRNVPDSWFR